MTKYKIRHLFAFYKSTISTSLSVGILVTLVVSLGDYTPIKLISIMLCVTSTFGLAIDALYRIIMKRDLFYFYHNAGCSIIELYIASFIISSTISLLLIFIIKSLWKFI